VLKKKWKGGTWSELNRTKVYSISNKLSSAKVGNPLYLNSSHVVRAKPLQRRCWTLVNHPKLFWLSTFSHTKSLGKLAYRMFCTPVNSVASERAFSAQNIIHTKSRNQLQSERADKLVYLYINGRQVTQFENKLDLARELKSKPLRNFSLDDEVALENLWMDEDVPVDGEIIRSVTNTDGYENEEEDCDENKKSEYEEDDEF